MERAREPDRITRLSHEEIDGFCPSAMSNAGNSFFSSVNSSC
ncbi:hypothetical protein [Enterobacter hormaechei]|nr:hypothetical protein CSC35_1969 [Enterobacter hormaechei]CDL31071.1 hypothetical protein [Enterobacter hormaechei]